MKRFASLIVALALVLSLTPALQITFAESKVRDNSGNIPATMLFNRWFRVGQDRDGVLLNPSTLDPADVVAKDAGGKGYRLVPWQKEGQEVWGRPSVNNDYAMPRLIPTQGWSALGRDEAGNRDFNNNYAINQYAWWTEIFLTVKPNAGESQMYAHWYAIIDTNGELWLDPDGIFHNCNLDITADPMFYLPQAQTYQEGSCLNNPKGTRDPLPTNNTQGPYNINQLRRDYSKKTYFWWKYDTFGNLVDRVWRIGWGDMADYDPIPNHDYPWNEQNVPNPYKYTNPVVKTPDSNGSCPQNVPEILPRNVSTVGYMTAYDPYLNKCVTNYDIDWDYKLNCIDFIGSTEAYPDCSPGCEVYVDANNNGQYDPYEYIYRKGMNNTGNNLEVDDIRLMNTSVTRGGETANYRHDTNVSSVDLDFLNNPIILPLNPSGNTGRRYVHTNGNTPGNPNDTYEYDEFIYLKTTSNTNFLWANLAVAAGAGSTQVTLTNINGLAIGETIYIQGNLAGQTESRVVTNIIGNDVFFGLPLGFNHLATSTVYELAYVEKGDIRLSEVNSRHNNSDESLSWQGAWWNDCIIMLEILKGGCNTPLYNITVESDLWEGMVPAATAATLRSPSGDVIGAAQHVQKTTALDPTGLEFRVPSTTFENIKLLNREYIGVEIFKDNGINNNKGDVISGSDQNSIRSSLSDDYVMWQNAEEFLGSSDVEIAKDFSWSGPGSTRPFFNDEYFIDLNSDNALGAGEPIYRDVDGSLTISAGDLRINDISIDWGGNVISYTAGSRVTVGDRDVGLWPFFNIPQSVRFHDMSHGCEPANGIYDIGEPIYYNPLLGAGMTVIYNNNFSTGFDPGNWMPINETNSGLVSPWDGSPISMEDPDNVYPGLSENIYGAGTTPGAPFAPANTPCMTVGTGKVLLIPSMSAGTQQRFIADVHMDPRNNPLGAGYYGSFGVVFRYMSDNDYWVIQINPSSEGTFNGDVWFGDSYAHPYTNGDPAAGSMIVNLIHFEDVGGYVGMSFLQQFNRPWNPDTFVNVDIVLNGDATTINVSSAGFTLNLGVTHAVATSGAFGFTKLAEDWGNFFTRDEVPAYIGSVQLLRPAAGAGDIVRITPVFAFDTLYPAGSRVMAGDFFRLLNPVYGVTMGKNCNTRYVDVEVLPGDIGLKVEIDKPLKVEQTSHVKVSVNPPPEGEYLSGRVIGDKRSFIYYRPDSFLARMIPSEYQVIYSSPEEAKRNGYKADFSVKGDVVYVSLRNSDVLETPFNSNDALREVIDKVGIIDAKHPVLEFEFTPYRGTVLDNLGQDMPALIRAYLDKGGSWEAPEDSKFTYSFNNQNPSDTRTVDTSVIRYADSNYVDTWHMSRKWQLKEAYANYYNQAYTRAARIVYSPYDVNKIADCTLANNYDCFGIEKLHINPEGINLIPSSPCVDPLSYRYPNISLTLKAFDNPDDVNDPSGYNMATAAPPRNMTNTAPMAVYNVNGAGIRYMCMARTWDRTPTFLGNTFYIVQVNDNGGYLYWRLNEPASTNPDMPQVIGAIDLNDTLSPGWPLNADANGIYTYPYENASASYMQRGSASADVGDGDCSNGQGSVDLCGSGFPPLGDVTRFDTYGVFNPSNQVSLYCYGVRSVISYVTATDAGGKIAIVCQPMDSNSKLNIRVHTTNVMVDYNNVYPKNAQDGTPWSYFITDLSGVHNASNYDGSTFVPSASTDYKTNPPYIRYYSYANLSNSWSYSLEETADYCDVISLKVMPPNQDVNFNNMYVIDHALQYSQVGYTPPAASGGFMLDPDEQGTSRPMTDPNRWIRPRYNPICVNRPLASANNTDVRSYPGGQTNLMRVYGSIKGAMQENFNAYPSLWPYQFGKLGTEFYGLTDYALYFELTSAPSPGYMGNALSFNGGQVKRIEIKGPFMTPLDVDPRLDIIRYLAGTGGGSTNGYEYKGLRYVPIKYNYSGNIVVDSTNYLAYELGPSNYTARTSPGCPNIGDNITFGSPNNYLLVGRELNYGLVYRGSSRVFVFDELIPIGAGRIEITVWLQNGVKKFYQDCCTEPPSTGIDVSGIKIENMPTKITVSESTTLKLKLTEGYGIESEGPPPEFGKKIQNFRECNDAYVYVWQDRGILDPVDKLYKGAGDGYPTMMPTSTYDDSVGTAFTEDQDLNNDGKISFDAFETEIMGSYDMATSAWTGGIIDARTFHRQDGQYMFALEGAAMPTTVGIDFGAKGVDPDPDHVIGEDEMLDVTVTAYKYGDDDNSRSFRPFWGGRSNSRERAFSHEVYLAGQAAASVEAKPDLSVEITPSKLTAGITPELVDPTKPLTFVVRDANQKPIDLSRGVADPRGGDEIKVDDAWIHLFKDPHPDNQYYYPGQILPQYYWLRTDLHNDDFSPVDNQSLYSFDRFAFKPIKFNWDSVNGKYTFNGFAANDKGEFEVHIYTPDRKHKAVAKVNVALPIVEYAMATIRLNSTEQLQNLMPSTGKDDDFIGTAADNRAYYCIITMKTSEGQLIQGIAETTSVCMGGKGQNARFNPFFTRSAHYDYVTPPSTTLARSRRSPSAAYAYNYYLTNQGGRSYQAMYADLNNSNSFGDLVEEHFTFGWSNWMDSGIRVNGRTGYLAPYYPTCNRMYEDGTYARYQAWDGPFDKPSAQPEGYGVGAIYNNPYENLYVFSDVNRDYSFSYRDSLLINNRGQGVVMFLADDACKFGVTVGVTEHAMSPAWSDVYGGTDTYNEYSPQRMETRFVHRTVSGQDYGTNDGAYFLDWDGMPNHYITIKYPTVVARWAETGEEIGKSMLNPEYYDFAYGVENHVILEISPADTRDLPIKKNGRVSLGAGDIYHPWGGNRAEAFVWATTIESPVNPRTRIAQLYVTPTGNGTDTMSVDLYQEAISGWFPLSHAYNLARFDVIMSLQVVADTSEPLRVGKDGTLTVYVQETTGKPVSGATVHIKGAGVESEKKSDKDGKVVFNVRPTERGRITIEASMENGTMKGSYTTVFVESYVEPPMLDLDPVQSIVSSGSLQVSGRTNQGTRITINGKPVQVSQDGKFTFTAKLNEGVNTIVVQATNQTGQTVTKVIRVESRTQPSGIIIDPLGDYENVTVIRVRGHVEPGCKVTITSDADGKAVEAVVSNDVFVADVAVKEGNNNITVDATDVVGKKSNKSVTVYVFKKVHVQLQLNSLVMVINGVPTRLTVAPQLVSGSTMVPFRAIAEAFGATPEYDQATKRITIRWENNVLEMVIGNKQATLNGNPITLTQAPMVIGGSTMVPLRFVENFGNVEIVWNASSKMIDIIRRK